MPFAVNQGIRIYYETEGSGPPLLLHHGLSDSIEGLRESGLVAALNPERRLILIDARGHGKSDKPHDPEAYALDRRAMDVVAVLDALDIEKTAYYGYSMGGVIGYGVAAHAPERLSSLVVGGAHPYASSMEFFRENLQAGLKTWLAVLEQLAGPLPESTVLRMMANDIDALRASVLDDRSPAFPKTPELTFPCRLIVADADPIMPLVEQFASEMKAGFFPLRGYNHFSAYVRPLVQVPVILGSDLFQPTSQTA